MKFDASHANSDLWSILGTELMKVPPTMHIEWKWIPRHINKEADELANAALDNRAPRTVITSGDLNSSITTDLIIRCITKVCSVRLRVLNHMPPNLDNEFIAFISSIEAKLFLSRSDKRMMFILAMHLISLNCSQLRSTDDFKHLRQHLMMLTDDIYLCQQLHVLAEAEPTVMEIPLTSFSAARILSLCKVGAFHKCIPRHGSTIETMPAPEIWTTIQQQAYPHVTKLPDELPCTPFTPTWCEITTAFKKLKSYKAATLSGWSKETLYPLIKHGLHIRDFISSVITDFVNATITAPEAKLLKTSVGHVLRYENADKRRTLMCPDVLLKWSLQVVLQDTLSKDTRLQRSANTYGSPYQCQSAVHMVQHAIDNGETPAKMDAVSAFPTVCRIAAFEYLRSHTVIYSKTYALMNLIYASSSNTIFFHQGSIVKTLTSTTGSHQGCTSGGFLHCVATIETVTRLKTDIVQVADDVHCIRNTKETFNAVVSGFAKISQKMDGPKSHFLDDAHLPAKVLGGLVMRANTPFSEIKKAIKPTLDRIMSPYRHLLELQASLQCKLLILRSLTFNWMYFMETFHPDAGHPLAEEIDRVQLDTFLKLFPGLQNNVPSPPHILTD